MLTTSTANVSTSHLPASMAKIPSKMDRICNLSPRGEQANPGAGTGLYDAPPTLRAAVGSPRSAPVVEALLPATRQQDGCRNWALKLSSETLLMVIILVHVYPSHPDRAGQVKILTFALSKLSVFYHIVN